MLRARLSISAAQAGLRLDAVLAEWLPAAVGRELSRSAVRRLVMAGAILIDGRPVRRPGLLVEAGRRLEASIDLARLAGSDRERGRAPGGAMAEHARGPRVPGSAIAVLYEDAWLLAVAKPAGLLMHASADARRADLFTIVRATLAARSGRRAGETYLGLHHRLDLDTSGVVLFAVDPAANAALARAFLGHEVEKVYHALVARPPSPPPARWVESASLAMSGTGRRSRMTAVSDGGSAAKTSFAIRQRLEAALLVEARPASGRKHQIRAHLAARHLHILGDTRYGGPAAVAALTVPRVMLHARALELSHPITGSPLAIRCPYPDDFRRLLTRLGGSLDSPGTSR